MSITTGTLIKWVESHRLDETGRSILVGIQPVYKYGIIMKVSQKDNAYLAVASCEDGRWHVVNVREDDYEILSEAYNG